MENAATKTGHFLAKILGIDLHDFHRLATDEVVTRGESINSMDSGETFVEEPPTTAEWIKSTVLPTGDGMLRYTKSLFPFISWIFSYNPSWLVGDLVAGEYIYIPDPPDHPA